MSASRITTAMWARFGRNSSGRRSPTRPPVLLSSDHGFFLGEHHLYDKRLMYEPSIRVPMMVSCPGRVKPGTSPNEMVLNLDMAPTLLESQDFRFHPRCRAKA